MTFMRVESCRADLSVALTNARHYRSGVRGLSVSNRLKRLRLRAIARRRSGVRFSAAQGGGAKGFARGSARRTLNEQPLV